MRETSSIFSKVFTVSTKRSNCRVGKSARVSLRALSSTSAWLSGFRGVPLK